MKIKFKIWISIYSLLEVLADTLLPVKEWGPMKTLLTSRKMVRLLQSVNHVRS